MGKNIRRRTNPGKRSSNVLPDASAGKKKKSQASRPPSVSLAKSRERLYNALDIAEADLEAKRRKNKKAGKISKSNNEDDDQDSDPDPLAGEDEPIDRNLIAGQEDLDEDEDEEIDSDEAFGSSDEEEILDSSVWKKKRKIRKGESYKPEYDEDELASEDESDASIDKSQFVTLTEAWDLDDKDKEEYEKSLKIKNKKEGSSFKLMEEDEEEEEEDDEDSEEEEESDDDEDSELSLSDDEDVDEIDEEQLSNLQAMISDLKKPAKVTKKNGSSALTADDYEKLQQTSAAAESEFSVRSSTFGFNTFGEGKLSLADLAGTVADKDVASHLKLIDTSNGSSGVSKKEKSMTLAVPLAKHIQQRLERRAAYDLTKEEVGKWKETVNTMKEAEHLSFPMVEPRKIVPHTISGASNDQEPATEMERRINEMLKASQLGPKQSSQPDTFEELAPAQMTLEELQQHRAQIRKMKELAYREQQKARRIKKIKSKTYRKIHRKEREREEELMREAGSEEEDEEDYNDEHDMQRARERIGQRHKTGGKWARDMIKHGMTKDVATRKELEEMLLKSEALREKMLGRAGGSDSDDSDAEQKFLNGEGSDSDDEQTLSTKQKLGKGVLAMKFMLDAEEAERKRNQTAKEELRRARDAVDGFGSEDEDSEDGGRTKGANVVINEGRRKYTPGSEKARIEARKAVKEARDDMELDEDSLESRLRASHKRKARGTNNGSEEEEEEEDEDNDATNGIGRVRVVYDDDDNDEEQPSSKKQKKVSFREREQDGNSDNDSDEENPWLTGNNDIHKKKSSVTVLGRDSSASDKSQAEIKKQRKKAAGKRETKASARDGLIDMNETLNVVDPFGDNDNDSDSDDDRSSRISFKQTDLVKQAFSGDDVVAEFEEEKASITKRDDDRVEDVTLPGWGGWGGAGLSARPKKRFVRKVAGVVRAQNRRDAKLENVIINERLTADQSHLHADKIPFPFETREQYERSLRMPIGQEWSTRMAHQKMVKPRVLVKPNLVIEPIRNPFKNDDDSDS
ncbi:uncharacterized protein SAPINGB_P000929 [Magnusiomyces paraingens]|uniref:U3 small nucleolar RNA-associated protein 14 n=1 Tax=Magnusiomyces paraingens TaxID=2606893 RepID=A0A5E8B342_9ASCO|nr:uncharacterized protein SAPINGB_P000929 [Saprochaete ingens]VVT45864.1 unnamed protein product [Saprochaete ingens]